MSSPIFFCYFCLYSLNPFVPGKSLWLMMPSCLSIFHVAFDFVFDRVTQLISTMPGSFLPNPFVSRLFPARLVLQLICSSGSSSFRSQSKCAHTHFEAPVFLFLVLFNSRLCFFPRFILWLPLRQVQTVMRLHGVANPYEKLKVMYAQCICYDYCPNLKPPIFHYSHYSHYFCYSCYSCYSCHYRNYNYNQNYDNCNFNDFLRHSVVIISDNIVKYNTFRIQGSQNHIFFRKSPEDILLARTSFTLS